MPVTRELATEMKVLFKDFIDEFLKSEEFFNRLTDVFTKKFDEKVDHMFALYVQKYNSLESELKILSNKSDELEQHTRRNNLRIIGIQEDVTENTKEVVLKFCSEKLNLKMDGDKIDRCHRTGFPINGNRSILIKFTHYDYKQDILQRRLKLKNTNIFVSEDLTKSRYLIYKAVQRKHGRRNTWTRDGVIFLRVQDTKYKIRTMEEFTSMK